jgi:hypothetical protein
MADHEKRAIPAETILDVLEGLFEAAPDQLKGALRGHLSYDVAELIGIVQRRSGCNDQRLAPLEWHFQRLLERVGSGPVVLYRWLATHPPFFIEVLGCLYRSEHQPAGKTKLASDSESRATSAFHLLHNWRLIPGTQADGSVAEEELRSWIDEARRLAIVSGHLAVCDSTIGGLLAHSGDDADGSWPCKAVRNVLEAIASDDLLHGFQLGIYNSRGVGRRAHREGGDQERALAGKFDERAKLIEITCPRTAALLRKVADRYRHDSAGSRSNAATKSVTPKCV